MNIFIRGGLIQSKYEGNKFVLKSEKNRREVQKNKNIVAPTPQGARRYLKRPPPRQEVVDPSLEAQERPKRHWYNTPPTDSPTTIEPTSSPTDLPIVAPTPQAVDPPPTPQANDPPPTPQAVNPPPTPQAVDPPRTPQTVDPEEALQLAKLTVFAIERLKCQVDEKNKTVEDLQSKLAEKDQRIAEKDQRIVEKDQCIKYAKEEIEDLKDRLNKITNKLKQQGSVAELSEMMREYN